MITFHIVACPSCKSCYPPERAETRCDGCGQQLPPMRDLPSLEGSARYVGTGVFMKGTGDRVTKAYEETNAIRPAHEGIAEDALTGPVICGWCGTKHEQRPESPNCPACGGVLPKPPGVDPGAPPPEAPRQLPSAFFKRLYLHQNVGGMVGVGAVVFGIIGSCVGACIIGMPMILLGSFIIYATMLTAVRRHRSLQKGETTIGIIEHVKIFGKKREKAKSSTVYMVYFRFVVDGELLQGMKSTYDPSVTNHYIGEPVWVVYNPRQLAAYDLWPPLA